MILQVPEDAGSQCRTELPAEHWHIAQGQTDATQSQKRVAFVLGFGQVRYLVGAQVERADGDGLVAHRSEHATVGLEVNLLIGLRFGLKVEELCTV